MAVVEIAGLDVRTAPAERIGQLDEAGVRIVERRPKKRARAARREADRVLRADALAVAGARIRLEHGLVALGARHADVDHRVPAVAALILAVIAERVELGLALEAVVADDALDAAERAFGGEAVGDRRRGRDRGRRAEAERQLDAALDLVVVEVGEEAVDRRGDLRDRLPLDRALKAEALQVGRGDVGFRPADDRGDRRGAVACIAPGVEFLDLVWFVEIRCRQRDAERIVEELVDIRAGDPVALVLRTGVELADIGIGAATADRDDALAIFDRADGAQVDRARQALADQRGVGGLVDQHLVDDLGRVLVVFDRAVVTGRGLLAAVQQRGREVGREAADRDAVRAAVDALRGEAGQAGDRLRDRCVGKLADVLGRDRLDDLVA